MDATVAVNLTQVKDAMISLLSNGKAFTFWMGRKVYTFAGAIWEVTKAALFTLAQFIFVIWREALPYLAKIGVFLGSDPGIFAIGILFSALFLHTALTDNNLTDHKSRYGMALFGYFVVFFTAVRGTQANLAFIPQLV